MPPDHIISMGKNEYVRFIELDNKVCKDGIKAMNSPLIAYSSNMKYSVILVVCSLSVCFAVRFIEFSARFLFDFEHFNFCNRN